MMNVRSFSKNILLLALIQGLCIGSAFFALRMISRKDYEAELLRMQENYLFQTARFAEQVNGLMNQSFQIIEFLATTYEGNAALPAQEKVFERLRRGSTGVMQSVIGLLFMDAEGKAAAFGEIDETLAVSLEKSSLLSMHRDRFLQVHSGTVNSTGSDRNWYISRRVDSRDGSFAGAFVLVFADDIFSSIQDENQLSMSVAAVFDPLGDILHRKVFDANLSDCGCWSLQSHPQFGKHASELISRGGTGVFLDSDSITTSCKLSDFSYGIAVSYDISWFIEEWRFRSAKTYSAGSVISFFFGLFLFFALYQLKRRLDMQKEKKIADDESALQRLFQEMQQDAKEAPEPRALLESGLRRMLDYLDWEGLCYFVPSAPHLGLPSEIVGTLPGGGGTPDIPTETLRALFSVWKDGRSGDKPLGSDHPEVKPLGVEWVLPFGIGESAEAVGIVLFWSRKAGSSSSAGSGSLRRISDHLLRLLVEKKADGDLRASLAEKEILLKEIHHRTKNNLQLVSSLLILQRFETDDQKASLALEKARNRVMAIALVHEEIYKTNALSSVELGDYVKSLAPALVHTLSVRENAVDLEISIPPALEIKLSQAVPCGLIFNELITNSLKYAFPGDRRGKIFIGAETTEGGGITITYRDDGIGFGETKPREGALGLRLIEAMTTQLGGRMEMENREGVTYRFHFRFNR